MTTSQPESFKNFSIITPSDDNRDRLVCGDCGWIHYENPRVIVGAVVRVGKNLLFCRRAIKAWIVLGVGVCLFSIGITNSLGLI